MDLDIKTQTNDTGNGEAPPIKKPPTTVPAELPAQTNDTGNGEAPPVKKPPQ
jgi:hypothetical protein